MSERSLQELQEYADTGAFDLVPISREIYSDTCTTIMALRRLLNVDGHVFLLESVENSAQGRYSFLGFDPSLLITCKNGMLHIVNGKTVEERTADPAAFVRECLAHHRSPAMADLPYFTGGLVGYFSYDYLKYAEPSLTLDAHDDEGFNDFDLMLFDKIIVFDNLRQKIIIIVNVPLANLEESYPAALASLDSICELLHNGQQYVPESGRAMSEYRQLFDEQGFCRMVETAKGYIREGDIFQVVLSNRLVADYEGSLLDTYRILRTVNPSPYMFYFSGDDIELAGASPETLVKLEGRDLFTFPLAGTRPRGATPEEDARVERELLADEKELAEHNMLVDLGRNDLGKICEFGSVKVDRHLVVERFSYVMHLGSTVHGKLRRGLDALDAIASVLPAGTLSGAPKIRACQIINDLEDNKRGVYGGAVGYLSFTGNMDMCIAIRLVFKKNGKVFVRSGAGIVADSVPETEYKETINKAKAVRVALEMAQGGVD